MLELPRFQLEKLKIHVFSDNKRQGLPFETIVAMFNPESYSQSYKNSFVKKYQGTRTSGRKALFKFAQPERLALTLLLDHTTITPVHQNAWNNMDVYEKVENFLKATSYVDGKAREPRYLQIEWGKLVFACRLESVNIKYQFFDRRGVPQRATLETQFVRDIDDDKRQKIAEKSSRDLVTIKRIDQGDSLPLIAGAAPSAVVGIAMANGLNSLRQLTPGTRIKVPGGI